MQHTYIRGVYGMSEDAKKASRRGQIGVEIFEQVERLVSDEGLTRTQAFERLSQETGRRSGTVAANYYRIARQRGATLQPRRGRGGGRRRRASGGVDGALARASEAIAELSSIVRAQEKELQRLREQADQFEKLRKWMDKNV
jgi:hypothetical protein